MSRRTLFLDRDGTLIVDRGYIGRAELIEPIPGAAEGLRELHAAGFELVVVSNQAGVARGYMTEADVEAVNGAVEARMGVPFRRIYYCPHHPDGIIAPYSIECDCRKPKAGLLRRAARELGVTLRDAAIVGDSLRDLMAGREVGARTVLVLTGHAAEYVRLNGPPSEADFVAPTMAEAAAWLRTSL
jgi:D-glycero-D-manno-heptose 1,7-bisphosphate phosphatase